MKKTWICIFLALAMLFCAACSNEGEPSSDKKKEESSSGNKEDRNDKVDKLEETANKMIASAGVEAVEVVVGEIEEGRYGSNALVTAKVPNYTELFTAAYAQKDPTKALVDAIDEGEYTTVDYQGYAVVYYENDAQIVETDELVKKFIEQELIKAVNAVLEGEEAVEE